MQKIKDIIIKTNQRIRIQESKKDHATHKNLRATKKRVVFWSINYLKTKSW